MGVLPVLVGAALLLSILGVALFGWAVASGQFNGLDVESVRLLHDEHTEGDGGPS